MPLIQPNICLAPATREHPKLRHIVEVGLDCLQQLRTNAPPLKFWMNDKPTDCAFARRDHGTHRLREVFARSGLENGRRGEFFEQ